MKSIEIPGSRRESPDTAKWCWCRRREGGRRCWQVRTTPPRSRRTTAEIVHQPLRPWRGGEEAERLSRRRAVALTILAIPGAEVPVAEADGQAEAQGLERSYHQVGVVADDIAAESRRSAENRRVLVAAGTVTPGVPIGAQEVVSRNSVVIVASKADIVAAGEGCSNSPYCQRKPHVQVLVERRIEPWNSWS